ncbi:MAG: hypothetical protein WD063_21610 [Pirellulales bacterium]
MHRFLLRADDVLRCRPFTTVAHRSDVLALTALVAAFGLLYGAAMGSFGGVIGVRALQVVYSAVKVPLLLLATFALSLPSFFVLNSLLGLRRDFSDALRALVATQAGLAVILASLAPFTLFWYVSFDRHSAAILFNALMFGTASLAAQRILRGYYLPLVRRNARHRWMLRIWIVVYAVVGIQMGWTLRPFIGDPTSPVQFFREDTWGNAYLILARLIRQSLTG